MRVKSMAIAHRKIKGFGLSKNTVTPNKFSKSFFFQTSMGENFLG